MILLLIQLLLLKNGPKKKLWKLLTADSFDSIGKADLVEISPYLQAISCADPEGGQGSGPATPEKKYRVSLQYWSGYP